jgi:polyhydroxyalkanoate synthesis regulator phasin
MNDNRRQILDMLAQGKINSDEAERLIAALERGTAPATRDAGEVKYLRVLVDANDETEGPTKVNVRVPMQLLRAGVRLTGVIPDRARDQVNEALRKEGIPFDINKLTPDNLEDLVEQLRDLTVDVDNERAKVRVFCE